MVLAFFVRSPPKIPEVSIPEEPVKEIAAFLRVEINRGFAIIRQIALGKDLKQFLSVCHLLLVFGRAHDYMLCIFLASYLASI